MSGDHRRNIEIKAEIADDKEFQRKVSIASKICDNETSDILNQRDVFFQVPNGRLKMRYENKTKVMLVQYARDDIAGPKLSKFNVLDLELAAGKLLEQMLTESNGLLGVLVKTRHLFMYQKRTRIHLDIVRDERKDKDYYGMEFEVMLEPHEDVSVGQEIASKLLSEFELASEQLQTRSYFEILNNEQ